MYNDRDRASNKRIIFTLSALVVGIVALFAVGNVLLEAALTPDPANLPVAAQPAEQSTTPSQTAGTSVVPAPVMPTTTPVEPAPSPVSKPTPSKPKPVKSSSAVVVIDAGHQKTGDSSLEPIGPGASERKAKVAGGTRGVATGNSESSINLEVAKRLRDELEGRGVKVIMIRTKQDVNISNSERAKIANEADADVFIRLHCDGAGGGKAYGLSTLIPGKNEWTGPILDESKKAGRYIHDATIDSTGANDRGLVKRDDLSGFNWSEVPTVLVEM